MKLDVTRVMKNAKETISDGAFQQAGSALSEAKNIVREEAQKRTSSEIKKIINKLQSNFFQWQSYGLFRQAYGLNHVLEKTVGLPQNE